MQNAPIDYFSSYKNTLPDSSVATRSAKLPLNSEQDFRKELNMLQEDKQSTDVEDKNALSTQDTEKVKSGKFEILPMQESKSEQDTLQTHFVNIHMTSESVDTNLLQMSAVEENEQENFVVDTPLDTQPMSEGKDTELHYLFASGAPEMIKVNDTTQHVSSQNTDALVTAQSKKDNTQINSATLDGVHIAQNKKALEDTSLADLDTMPLHLKNNKQSDIQILPKETSIMMGKNLSVGAPAIRSDEGLYHSPIDDSLALTTIDDEAIAITRSLEMPKNEKSPSTNLFVDKVTTVTPTQGISHTVLPVEEGKQKKHALLSENISEDVSTVQKNENTLELDNTMNPVLRQGNQEARVADGNAIPVIARDLDIGVTASQSYTQVVQAQNSHNQAYKAASNLAFQLQQQVNNGNKEFTLKLYPEQLGAVDVKMIFDKDGKVSASFHFDNDVALDYVRNHFNVLEKAFESVGINTDKNSIQLSLGNHGQGKSFAEQFARQDQDNQQQNNMYRGGMRSVDSTEHIYTRHIVNDGGVDILV